jgi:hypothetical protein
MESEDEELAHEFLVGIVGPKGRGYLKPNSEHEKKARQATARILRKEAGRDGWFTRLVADLIDPSTRSLPRHFYIKRKIVFQRPRGTPVVVSDRKRAEIAAFIHNELAKQKAKAGPQTPAAQARNLKPVIAATGKEFGIKKSTVWGIWADFKLKRRTPIK